MVSRASSRVVKIVRLGKCIIDRALLGYRLQAGMIAFLPMGGKRSLDFLQSLCLDHSMLPDGLLHIPKVL